MKRLTDPRVANALQEVIEKLRKAGIEPSFSDICYVKLAEYENIEERREMFSHYEPDGWYE